MNSTRILVVDDDPDLLPELADTCRKLVASDPVQVDTASTRDGALELLQRKTFHVALVDIMLNGPHDLNDRGGIDVLAKINELDEGTQVIVLSATKDVGVPVDAWLKHRAFSYVQKINIAAESDVLDPVHDALAASSGLKAFGHFRSLIDYLAANQGEMAFADRAVNTLQPMDGWSGLNVFMHGFLGPLSPLLPPRGVEKICTIQDGLLRTNLWSKALGQEVELIARHAIKSEEDPVPTPSRPSALEWHYRKCFVNGWAYTVADSDRTRFYDRIDDLPARFFSPPPTSLHH